jgi:cyclohexanone monooxygenase
LIDLGDDPIEAITATGIRTATSDHALDVIVMATGFDAGTGGLTQIDFRDTSDRRLADLWGVELQTHLGIGIPGFPNLFMVYGPQSPSAFWNGPTASEIQGDWVTECLCSLRDGGITRVEATAEAAAAWTRHMAELADDTLLPQARSWYMGANIPGKPIQLLHYFGAIDYMEHCRESARNNYSGFVLS